MDLQILPREILNLVEPTQFVLFDNEETNCLPEFAMMLHPHAIEFTLATAHFMKMSLTHPLSTRQ
jgi:hypothetical protein